MEIFNIGPLELLFILVIALVVLGPKEMVNTAKKLSRTIAKIIRSPFWASMMDTTREIREFPRKLMRETGLEENLNEISKMRHANLPNLNTIGDPLRPATRLDAVKTAENDSIEEISDAAASGEVSAEEPPADEAAIPDEMDVAKEDSSNDETTTEID